ncbi:hypothetical protein QAD02_000545 [Eretmocerus hayati]|uniref:Uncharacterized protein n=1 Tax=Eretmocerus hayati TaxID=131215 RepID=A0ACC2NEH1_9HYME|nr:hypothetical protein QAD02_000545 [Eretmocerus hayati]
MDVTRSNYQEVLIELDEVLKHATFLSIDSEFTGLFTRSAACPLDSPAQYYAKLRSESMNFLLIQLGLSSFTHDRATNKYKQQSYNFYVFPKPFDRSSPDCRFLCQASSLNFLAKRGFDFNKLFREGIPYLTQSEEQKLNEKVLEKQRLREEVVDLIDIPVDLKPTIEEICARIENFIGSENDELVIEKCNAFIRKLVYQEVQQRWPTRVRLESSYENMSLVAYRMGTAEEEREKEAKKKEQEMLEVQEAVGLSTLMRKLCDSGKLIVGHNLLMDLCHIVHQFLGPLPEDYNEFKSLLNGLFPRLLDTKILAESKELKESVPSSILDNLLDTIQSPPFSVPEIESVEGRSYSLEETRLHEAGYDAFATGVCFIALYNRLASLNCSVSENLSADSLLLKPYMNKLHITSVRDSHINLEGNDPVQSRGHVFHITFPREWRASDLSKVFSPYGGARIYWLGDTTAYAELNHRDQVSAVVQNLFKSAQYTLQKYREYHKNSEMEKSVKQERKRKLSESNDLPVKDGSPHPDKETSNETSKNSEDDGWEIASGKRKRKRARVQAATGNGEQNKKESNKKAFTENDSW